MSAPTEAYKIPVPLVTDYIQLGYLVILFAVGAPLNLAAFSELKEKKPSGTGGLARLHLLKVHLNFSDLLVVFVYTPSQACWLLTYDWRGGDFLCKTVKFAHSFSFQISSNIVVCIALNRLLSAFKSVPLDAAQDLRRVKITLALAWVLAAFTCAPQLAVWQEFEANARWKQCVSVWQVRAFQQTVRENFTDMHSDFYPGEFAYNIAHLLFVFWLPLTCVAVSYLTIAQWIWQRAKKPDTHQADDDSPEARQRLHSSASWWSRRITKSTIISYRPSNLSNNKIELEAIDLNLNCHKQDNTAGSRRESRKNSNTVRLSVNSEPRSLEHAQEVVKVRRNAVRVSLLLVVAYVITWLPYHVLSLWELVDRKHFQIHTAEMDFAHGLVVFNSVINPFLYGMFGRFKRYTRSA